MVAWAVAPCTQRIVGWEDCWPGKGGEFGFEEVFGDGAERFPAVLAGADLANSIDDPLAPFSG